MVTCMSLRWVIADASGGYGDNGFDWSEYDSATNEIRLYFWDSINTSFNAQDLLNSISVYADDTLTNEIYGAISGILNVESTSIELTLDESNLAGYDNQDLYLVYDDVNGVLTNEDGSAITRFEENFWIGDNNSWDDGGDSGEFDYADFDSTNNTVCLYFFDEINTSFNTDDLINSLSVRMGHRVG